MIPPRAPLPTKLRSQVESFLVLRRNPLELWGAPAYELPIAAGKFLGRQQMLLNAPEAIRHVLVTNADNYRRNEATRRVLAPILGEGLFLAEGDNWRHQRRTIAPALAPRAMPLLARHIAASCAEEETALAQLVHRPLVLLPRLQSLALSIAGRSMFSLEMSGVGAELRRLITEYGTQFAQPSLPDLFAGHGIEKLLPSSVPRGRAGFRTKWLEFLDRLITARNAAPGAPGTPRDLFDLLEGARDPETGGAFSGEQLRDEVSTMILAGHETTALALFWSLYLAARDPAWQAEMAAEAQEAGIDEDPAAVLGSVPRIRAHVDETLRLYPPAFMLTREAIAPDEIAGRQVAAGTVVVISPWVLHRHRKLWRNPDGFDPSRFMPGAPPVDRFAYLPFGAGPRICVGSQFALSEAVLVLTRILRRFRIELSGTGMVLPRGIVTTQPDRDVRFVLSPRAA